MKKTAKITYTLLIFIVLHFTFKFSCLGSPKHKELSDQRSKLQLDMAKLRLKLFQENKELSELNKRIIKLQKQLVEQLRAQPKMHTLAKRLMEIEEELHQSK